MGRRGVRGIVTVAATALVSTVLLAAAPGAQAATTYTGRTTATVNVRSAPTTFASDVGTIGAGTTITLRCKVFGPSVGGNSYWYKLGTGRWITARYVSNVGSAPGFCGTGSEYAGRATVALNVRSGPNTANAVVSSVPAGGDLALVCKVDGQAVDGNPRWYQLSGDSAAWVAARYVTNVGTAPPYC
ncbi:SH3 domain-containing protein [Actinopolymorpha sp. NPDC004070]|uniref:SH3 domain-containing protein n=1 Tax=Actinopolymorpha sp. NPDC004070 TaxID=3154548 RepID=UPI0033A3E353